MTDYKPIIVLDDDPTGTQTVHNVPIITEWTELAIKKEFDNRTPFFFILTNSRALIAEEANKLGIEIGQNIAKLQQNCWILSRGDSTLRGHFPNEIEALAKGLAWDDDYLMVLIPAFFEGNRFTKNDVHYWVEKDKWIPVGETPFAQDKTFGYKSSDLKAWVEEKTKGKIKASSVVSITLDDLEKGDEKSILDKINKASKILIVNALNYNHLHVFSKIIKQSARNIIFRTSASFVAVFGDIEKKPLLENKDFQNENTQHGGLIVVGSHVPKTTAQLNELLKTDIQMIEVNVKILIGSGPKWFEYLTPFIFKIDNLLKAGKSVVLYTSRDVILGKDESDSLQKSLKVSNGLVWIIKQLGTRPRFLIAKGGITSSDLATKALRVKRAMLLGQIEAGIPVWQLGSETKFPNMPYIVFPGNVGSDNSLRNIYEKFK
jgi:uncharacterized protein YgbK (DUF1537 family)